MAYLQTEHFQKDAGVWTAAWRAAVLDPGYGSYSLNAVDSFWKLLDHYVPEEKTLPLRQKMERYEHTGRVFQNDGKWSALCVAPSTLVTPRVGRGSIRRVEPPPGLEGRHASGAYELQDVATTACAGTSLDVGVQHRARKCHDGVLQIWSLGLQRRGNGSFLRSGAVDIFGNSGCCIPENWGLG